MTKETFKDELLNDAELNNVAGGTTTETYRDVDEFESLGIKVYCTDPGIPLNDLHTWTMMNLFDAYKRFGVEAKIRNDDTTPNKYFIDGKEVSREEVWNHIRSQLGK